jgi:hypothetical protein
LAAAAAEIFINCLRQRRRRLRTVWVSAAAARKSFKISSHRRRRLDFFEKIGGGGSAARLTPLVTIINIYDCLRTITKNTSFKKTIVIPNPAVKYICLPKKIFTLVHTIKKTVKILSLFSHKQKKGAHLKYIYSFHTSLSEYEWKRQKKCYLDYIYFF